MTDDDRNTGYDSDKVVKLYVRDGMVVKLNAEQLVTLADDIEKVTNSALGVQEPPQDYRIFNRKRGDGTYPPVDDFFMKGIEEDDEDIASNSDRAMYLKQDMDAQEDD